MREDPCFNPRAGNCDVLDEIKAPARHSAALVAVIGPPVTANRMLHRL
jgi:hypothetical protein